MKNFIIVPLIIVLSFSMLGCLPAAPDISGLTFSQISPLILGQLPNSHVLFNYQSGIVFFTENLPAIGRPFSVLIPFSGDIDFVKQEFVARTGSEIAMNVVNNTLSSWNNAGFREISRESALIKMIETIVSKNPNMTWVEFCDSLKNLQQIGTLIDALEPAIEIGSKTLVSFPILFVTTTDNGTMNFYFWDNGSFSTQKD